MAGESIYQSALEVIPDNLLLWSPDGRVIFANHRFLETFGLLAEDVEGLNEKEFEERLTQRGISFEKQGADGRARAMSFAGRRFERRQRPVPGGARLEQVVDLTDAELRRKQKEKVLSVTTHDLRAPLANVRSYASLLLGGRMADADPRVKRAAEVISRNADKSLRLVQSYFDTLRAEVGALPLDKQPVSLLPMLEEAVKARRPIANEKGVTIVENLPSSLPSAVADRERLAQVFTAFLDNAIQRAAPRSKIEVQCEDRRGELWFGFTDHGPPLAPDEAAVAFDRDHQILKERRLGSGFGLAVARAMVKGHGGSAGVDSTSGGTTFHFTLPRGLD